MALPEKLIEKLACPKCRGPLEYEQEPERLICNRCRLAYRVKDGIPVLLVDEAQKLN
jgi:uncharacterized protein YbaR (Trm112 family)